MRRILLVVSVFVATVFFGSATLVSASNALGDEESLVADAPFSHEADEDEDGEDAGHGPPPDRGRPDGSGRPETAGLLHSAGGPELPSHAAPQAHDAVQLAFERQLAIQEKVAEIRALPRGQGRGPAVSELMKEFGALYGHVSDAGESGDA